MESDYYKINSSNHDDKHNKKRKRTRMVPVCQTILIKVHREPIGTSKYTQKTIEKTKQVGIDR